jgi:hypothetical protein
MQYVTLTGHRIFWIEWQAAKVYVKFDLNKTKSILAFARNHQ